MTPAEASKILTPKQERKVRAIRALLADDSVPAGLARAAKALRGAARAYARSTEANYYDAAMALYAASMIFDEEVDKCS